MEVPHSAAPEYCTLKLLQLFKQLIPGIQWQGDGSVGTIFCPTVAPGGPLPNRKEKIVTLDHQKRVKDVDVIGAGVLKRDFTFFRSLFEIIAKGPNTTTIRSSIKYELDPKSPMAAENMQYANVMDMEGAGHVTNSYLTNQNQGGGGGNSGGGGGSGQRPSGGWGEPENPPPAEGGVEGPPSGARW